MLEREDLRQIRSITKDVLREEHLDKLVDLFGREHHKHRGTHDLKFSQIVDAPDYVAPDYIDNRQFITIVNEDEDGVAFVDLLGTDHQIVVTKNPHDFVLSADGQFHIYSAVEQPYIRISNLSDSEMDPVLQFGVGVDDTVKFTLGVDDSDRDAFRIDKGGTLGPDPVLYIGNTNTIFGEEAGQYAGLTHVGCLRNVIIGYEAVQGKADPYFYKFIGYDNIIIGPLAARYAQNNPHGNVVIGHDAFNDLFDTCDDNVLIGEQTAKDSTSPISRSVFLGAYTGASEAVYNVILLGYGAWAEEGALSLCIIGRTWDNTDLGPVRIVSGVSDSPYKLTLYQEGTVKEITPLIHVVNPASAADMVDTGVGILMGLRAYGYDNAWYPAGHIVAVAETDWLFTDDEYGGNSTIDSIDSYLGFYTSLDGVLAEKARITSDAKLGIGTPTPGYALDLVGDINCSGFARASSLGLSLGGDRSPGDYNAKLAIAGAVSSAGNAYGMTTYQLELAPADGYEANFGYYGGGQINVSAPDTVMVKCLNMGGITKVGGGTISAIYGFFLNEQDAGVANWGIYQVGPSNKNYFQGQIQSAIAGGTAPFIIASTTVNANLNADYLDGLHYTSFAAAVHYHDSDYISIIAAPAANHFPYQTAGGELIDSTYDAADFATAGHNHSGTYEPALGNPGSDGYALVSTALGVRSWAALLSSSFLGLGSLADPNADRIMFWDYSEGALKWLAYGNSVAITGTTLDAIQDIRTTANPTFQGMIIGGARLAGWPYRKRIDLPVPTANLTDFPVEVPIIADADIGAECRADGFDIRFTAADGVTLLSYERESFAVAGGEATAIFWVKTDVAVAGTYLWLYYGNLSAADGQNAEAVWDANFKAVYHMNDATTSTILDSTANNNDGAKTGANEPIEADGKIGKAQSFAPMTGLNDYIDLGNGATLNAENDDVTLEAMVYPTVRPSAAAGIIGGENGAAGMHLAGPDGLLTFTKVNVTDAPAGPGVPLNEWSHVACTFDNSESSNNVKYYLNGALLATASVDVDFSAGAGSRYLGALIILAGHFHIGLIDEVRISVGVIRSADWIAYEYANMNPADGGLTWGAEETLFVDVDGDVDVTGAYRVDGIQVLKEQQAAIADPTGGLVTDVECRAQLALALAMLRTHGIIST